jgi:hypothetical protein
MITSYVYIITDGEYYKIGRSCNPRRRLKQLQTASVKTLRFYRIYVVDKRMCMKLERRLHAMLWFAKARVMSEWFNLQKEHLDFIDDWMKQHTVAESC